MGFLLLSGTALGLPAHAQAPIRPSQPTWPSYTVTLTAYNAVPDQTDDDPFTTASGAYSNPEIVAARSRDLAEELPFGTIIELYAPNVPAGGGCGFTTVADRIGYRVIADTMHARYADRIDVLLDTGLDYATEDKGLRNAAEVLGRCEEIGVRVVGRVDVRRIPKTQAELAAMVSL